MESVRSQSSRPVLPRLSFGFQRSLSPTRHHCPHSSRSSSPPPASSASAFSFNSLSTRSLSPTRSVNLRSVSPGKHLQPNNNNVNVVVPRIKPKKTCMCSPTNHPGSFRCSLHRNTNVNSSPSRRGGFMEARRSAMTNSLVRICSVEGDFMLKRALSSLIRPSSHQVRRRSAFHPTPSRLSRMTKADGTVVIF